jgi:hypothetical protein
MVEEESPKPSGLAGVPMLIASAAIIVWIAFVVVMAIAADASDERWTRLSYVFASVEAIAFAAAGALFGVTVQRERVIKAEAQAEANMRDAANGRALGAMLLADEGRPVDWDQDSVLETAEPDDLNLRRRHADVARRLFPDL